MQKKKSKKNRQTYRQSDLRPNFLDEASQNTFFAHNPGALDLLLNALNKVLLEYPPKEFDSCDAYLQFLVTVIEDSEHQLHQNIIDTASQTDIDQDLGLEGDDILRLGMLKHKKTVMFNILRKEVVYLCQEFNKECPLLPEEEPAPVYLESIAQRQPQPEQSSPSFILAFFINLFNFFTNHQDPLARQNLPRDDQDLLDLDLLQRIQLAVSNAQTSYKDWFEDKAGAKEIRGRDGFFSRYRFRHSASGQKRATDLKDDICKVESEQVAIALVNSLLQHSNTAYNRHSFASFLLDELKLISNGPWSAITANSESNLYDRATVLTVLETYVYREIPEPTRF